MGIIAYKGDVYALGGFNGIARMCSAERYCPRSNKWRTIADMGGPRSNFADEVTRVSIFNPPLSSRPLFLKLLTFLHKGFSIRQVLDGMIFILGGFNGVTTIYNAECYNGSFDEW